MISKINTKKVSLLLLLFTLCAVTALAQTTSFTYQGRLTDGGTPANVNYDLQFALFDSLAGGTQIGATQTSSNISVSAGIFSVQLDFGANAFPGANRFLEISARLTGAGSFTPLAPRQPITSTPYAIRSLNASSADVVTVSGVPAGSGNYIQNATTPQANANFNISGNATAGGTLSGNVVIAATQYNIGGLGRVLSVGNVIKNNIFVGGDAGTSNTTGFHNSFVGGGAGLNTTSGFRNSFFGADAGISNFGGSDNTAIGAFADVGSGALTNATAIGACAKVDRSNSLVLGSIDGCDHTAFVNVGIGTTMPTERLTIQTATSQYGFIHTDGTITVGSFVGGSGNGGWYGTKSNHPLHFFTNNSSPQMTLATTGNIGIGTTAPQATLDVHGTALLTPVSGKQLSLGTPNGETGMGMIAAGSRADIRFDGLTLKLVAIGGGGIPPSTSGLAINLTGSVGIGRTDPVRLLDVNGRARVASIPLEASFAQVCFNQAGDLLQCGGSSLRWKTNVRPFFGGLDIVRRLRPINFNWKESGQPDIGLGAEDVAKVAPSLTFVNSKGEAEGVKYERLNIVLINAVKEQQQEIERQQKQIATLLTSNAALNARLRGVEKSLRKKAGSARRRR